MNRREFVSGVATALALPWLAVAQNSGRLPTLGILSFTPEPTPEQFAASPATRRLQELGWVEGKTFAIERAYSAGRNERLPELAADLVRKRVDLIWAFSPLAAVAAARATKTIPIVFVRVAAPLELGLAQSLARPGGNVTGVASTASIEVYAKPFEFLREIKPEAKRVSAIIAGGTVLTTVAGGVYEPPSNADLVARHTGIDVSRYPIAKSEDLDAAFASIVGTRSQAIYASSSPLIFQHRQRIADFALQHRLPSVFIEKEFVEAGGLLSYGSDVIATIIQSLGQVDRILRGAKPADIPIEQPTRFDLVVNLKTARAIGVAIPQTVLLRAERVIE
jgi:putative ABC transport system substrate-binding protein